MSWPRLTGALLARAALHPRLAIQLARVAWRFRRRDWNRRPPFLPLPPPEYVRWRMSTAYGDAHTTPPVDDVVRYVRWVARFR